MGGFLNSMQAAYPPQGPAPQQQEMFNMQNLSPEMRDALLRKLQMSGQWAPPQGGFPGGQTGGNMVPPGQRGFMRPPEGAGPTGGQNFGPVQRPGFGGGPVGRPGFGGQRREMPRPAKPNWVQPDRQMPGQEWGSRQAPIGGTRPPGPPGPGMPNPTDQQAAFDNRAIVRSPAGALGTTGGTTPAGDTGVRSTATSTGTFGTPPAGALGTGSISPSPGAPSPVAGARTGVGALGTTGGNMIGSRGMYDPTRGAF